MGMDSILSVPVKCRRSPWAVAWNVWRPLGGGFLGWHSAPFGAFVAAVSLRKNIEIVKNFGGVATNSFSIFLAPLLAGYAFIFWNYVSCLWVMSINLAGQTSLCFCLPCLALPDRYHSF